MKIDNIQDLGFHDQSVVTFEIDKVPDSHQEWSHDIGELPINELFVNYESDNSILVPNTESYSMTRRADGSQIRDWWAGDHLWHVDGTRWAKQPVYTVMTCRESDPGSPDTEILDTVAVYERSLEDGFWKRHGFTESDLAELQSIFVDSTYYRETLPYLKSLASDEDKLLIDSRVAVDLAKSKSIDLDEHADKDEVKHPIKAFPLVQRTPKNGLDTVFMDGGGRNATVQFPDGTDLKAVLHDFRIEYLSGEMPRSADLVRSVGWTANKCIIFPQIGTLHRAMPGNEHDRTLHLGFLVKSKVLS